jgi:hypothetical protein
MKKELYSCTVLATVAQMVEHLTRNEDVCGSIPHGGSIFLTGPLSTCVAYITHLRKNWNYFVLFVSLLNAGIILFGLLEKSL